MRRMYSDGQVVKVVNKAIEAGEIQAGGLTPEQKEKLDNSLQLPETAPAAQQLVGINTSGAQNALGIGEGLIVDGSTLKAGEAYLTIDFKNGTTVTDETIKATLTAGTYNLVKILNYAAAGRNYEFKKSYISGLAVNSSSSGTSPSISRSGDPIYILSYSGVQIAFNNDANAKSNSAVPALGLYLNTPNGKPYVILQYVGSSIKVVCSNSTNLGDILMLPYTSQVLQLAGGTLTSGNYPILDYQWNGKPKPYNNLTYEVVDSDVDANAHILMRATRYDWPNRTIYIFGQYINDGTGAVTASYTGTINCQNGTYTITKHTA